MKTRRQYLRILSAGAAVIAAPKLLAQDKSTIKIFSAGAPGSGSDATIRQVADRMRESLDRPVIVEIKSGAGQRVAISELKRAIPDGRSLLFFTDSAFTLSPHIYKSVGYDPVKDFTPIAGIGTFDMGVATGPMTGSNDMRSLVNWLIANDSKAFYGTPGTGSLPQFLGMEIGNSIKVQAQHVPYKDWSIAITDLVTGRLPVLIHGLSTMLEMHRSGKIQVIAVTGDARSPLLPDVPTLKEAGVPISSVVRMGIMGPAGMSADLVQILNASIVRAVNSKGFAESVARYGTLAAPLSGLDLATALAQESRRLQALVKSSGYMLE